MAVVVFRISVHFMPWNIDLNLDIDSLILLSYFKYHFLEGMCIVARFLTCRVEESRAGMEAEPLLCFPSTMYLDLSIRYVTLFSFWINNCLNTFPRELTLHGIQVEKSTKHNESDFLNKYLVIHCDAIADCSLDLLSTWFDENSYLSSKKADFELSGPPKHLI